MVPCYSFSDDPPFSAHLSRPASDLELSQRTVRSQCDPIHTLTASDRLLGTIPEAAITRSVFPKGEDRHDS